MPKITVHGGPSNAATEQPDEVETTAVADETEQATAAELGPTSDESMQDEQPKRGAARRGTRG